MARFIVEETRLFIVEAIDEDAAFNKFLHLTEEELEQSEVDGGSIQVDAFNTVH